jgi:hypothetical protein
MRAIGSIRCLPHTVTVTVSTTRARQSPNTNANANSSRVAVPAAWACAYEGISTVSATLHPKVVFKTPMHIRGPCGLPPSHSIARTVRTARHDTLCKSIHSSVVRQKDGSDQNKLYANSLLLPRTTFPQWTNPLKTEVLLRKKTCDNLYRWQVRS